jgi:hypothetical protein
MEKRTMIFLLVAAAAVAGFVLWSRRRQGLDRFFNNAAAASVPTPTVAPTQLAPQAIVSNAFSDLLQAGQNWASQYFRERVAPRQADAVPYKPPPITSKGPSPAVPAANTPAIVTTPTGYYA